MAIYEVTAAKLNKRTAPVEDASNKTNVSGTVFKGFRFDSQREQKNSLGAWQQDMDGFWYWGGALKLAPAPAGAGATTNTNPPPSPDDPAISTKCQPWMLDLKLPEIWQHATGRNVGVAVIDTGIVFGNSDLPFSQKVNHTFAKGVSLEDSQGHGTNCAGLIGAKNRTGTAIGVAPDCNLYISKIAEGSSFDDPTTDVARYAEALNWCADQKEIQVISISWGDPITDNTVISTMQTAFDKALTNGKIVVCSIGDASMFIDATKLYPACLERTIAVGAIPVDQVVFPFVNSSLLVSAIGNNIVSHGINFRTAHLTGTSQSNAIVAGIVALIVQKKGGTATQAGVAEILTNASRKIKFTIGDSSAELSVLDGDLLLNFFKS